MAHNVQAIKRVYVVYKVYPVRNNASLLCPVHHAVQGSAAGLGPRTIMTEFNVPLSLES
jgi:hypothetical protein